MEEEKISVREWQEQFRAGAFESGDIATQCRAGWYDWFCEDGALAERLKEIGRVVMGITEPFILDNFYVWFQNNCTMDEILYDEARFELLNGKRDGKYFIIGLDSPHENTLWTLHTERAGYAISEYGCSNISDMIRYVNAMGREFEQGIVPEAVTEIKAVEEYIRQFCGAAPSIEPNREGAHSYSFYCRYGEKLRKCSVIAAKDPKEAPPGFDAAKAVQIQGFQIYSPDEPPTPQRQAHKKSAQKKDVAR